MKPAASATPARARDGHKEARGEGARGPFDQEEQSVAASAERGTQSECGVPTAPSRRSTRTSASRPVDDADGAKKESTMVSALPRPWRA